MNTPSVTQHNISIRTFDVPDVKAGDPVRFLLLKLDHIGDFVTALKAFRLLRRSFPKAEITLMCLPGIVELAQGTGLFDRVVGFDAEPESPEVGKVAVAQGEALIARFKAGLNGHYTLAADFKHDVFTPPWLDSVDATYRAGFARETQKGLDIVLPTMEWHVPFTEMAKKNPPVHAEVRLTLLAHAIVEALQEISPNADAFAVPKGVWKNPEYKALQSTKKKTVGICVGAGAELRQWSLEYWAALARRLVEHDKALLVFFGGAGDKVETQIVTAALPEGSFIDLTGVIPLAHAPAYMRLLKGYIGCDTGLTHLAAGLGLPTVNIYAGISNPSIWRARGDRVKTVFAEVICAPCHFRFKKDCPNGNVCMSVIGPEIVYTCFQQVMTP